MCPERSSRPACFKGGSKIHRATVAAVSEAECLLHLEVSYCARDRAQQPNSPGNLVGDLVGNLVSDLVGIRCPGTFVRLCP